MLCSTLGWGYLKNKSIFCSCKPLTCCGDAVEAHEGVEAGGGARQNAAQAERSEPTFTKVVFNPGGGRGEIESVYQTNVCVNQSISEQEC